MKDHPATTPQPSAVNPFSIDKLVSWIGQEVLSTRVKIADVCDTHQGLDLLPELNERKETLHRVNDKISELKSESVTPPLLEEFEDWCKDLREDTGRYYVQDALMLIKAFKNSKQHEVGDGKTN